MPYTIFTLCSLLLGLCTVAADDATSLLQLGSPVMSKAAPSTAAVEGSELFEEADNETLYISRRTPSNGFFRRRKATDGDDGDADADEDKPAKSGFFRRRKATDADADSDSKSDKDADCAHKEECKCGWRGKICRAKLRMSGMSKELDDADPAAGLEGVKKHADQDDPEVKEKIEIICDPTSDKFDEHTSMVRGAGLTKEGFKNAGLSGKTCERNKEGEGAHEDFKEGCSGGQVRMVQQCELKFRDIFDAERDKECKDSGSDPVECEQVITDKQLNLKKNKERGLGGGGGSTLGGGDVNDERNGLKDCSLHGSDCKQDEAEGEGEGEGEGKGEAEGEGDGGDGDGDGD